MEKPTVFNWKMNPLTEKQALKLARASDRKNIVVAPPFLFLEAVSHVLKRAKLGAQDLAWEDPGRGSYTGEVSAEMLKDADVKYVILGHSERRRFLKETDAVINKKLRIALKEGFCVILCVGERWSVRRKGLASAQKFVKNQLQRDLKGLTNNLKPTTNNLIVAYEPVWAIGTGRNDTPEDAVTMATSIKKLLVKSYKLKVKILYGGSVNSKNINNFLSKKEINGVLVGGASARLKDLKAIIKKIREYTPQRKKQ